MEKWLMAIALYFDYLLKFDFIALPMKKGNFTVYAIFDSGSARELVAEKVLKKLWRLDGAYIRWKAPSVIKMPWHDIPKPLLQLTISNRWNEFEVISGNMARAQEMAVCKALNLKHWQGIDWMLNSTKGGIVIDNYTADIIGEQVDKDGNIHYIRGEVKGIDSPVFYHGNDEEQ